MAERRKGSVSPRRMSSGTPARAPQPQRALKYRYDAFMEEWTSEESVVMIARKPFADGGMRWCYKMYEIDQDGKHAPGVAKVFKDDALEGEDDEAIAMAYFDEAMTQTVADSFAQQYNKVLGNGPENEAFKCRFLPVRVMQFNGKRGPRALCNCEPYLQGEYVKHNDNDGHVETAKEVPQAFSHFTWEYSNQMILVCDIQGVDHYFTDPQIHSHDGKSFGMGNIGMEGINKFLETHKCNSICKKLGLAKPEKMRDGTWKVGTGSVVQSRTASLSSSDDSVRSQWTSKRYDGALTQAVTRVTKKKTGDSENEIAPAVKMTKAQLEMLQAKLMLLIQQHGSMNQMLLSPQRLPRKPPKVDGNTSPHRPWSPVRDPREAGKSPVRTPAEAAGQGQSDPNQTDRSGHGLTPLLSMLKVKMSSSYDVDPKSETTDRPDGNKGGSAASGSGKTLSSSSGYPAGQEGVIAMMKADGSPWDPKNRSPIVSPAPRDRTSNRYQSASKSKATSPWNESREVLAAGHAKLGAINFPTGEKLQQQSSPSLFGPSQNEFAAMQDAMCKYCSLKGPVEQVLKPGPMHQRGCKRWSAGPEGGIAHQSRSFAVRTETMPNDLLSQGAAAATKDSDKQLSDEDRKKKRELQLQMLDLKRQLEEQLQRLQHTDLLDKGSAAAGRQSPQRSSSKHSSAAAADSYDRL